MVSLVGIHDNFFDLGGNSLLALSLMAQIKEICGRNLPLAVLYQAPTVEQLAKLIVQDLPLPTWSSLVPLQPSGSRPPFFWIHGENSDAFLPRYLGSDQPIYGLRHQSEDGRRARYTTVEDIAAHHLSEIRAVQPHGPYFIGGYCFGGMIAFEIAKELRKFGENVPLLVLVAPEIPQCRQTIGNPPPGNNARFGRSVYHYLRTLKGLERRAKLSYVATGMAAKINQHLSSPLEAFVKNITRKLACNLYFTLGCRLPVALRSPYILAVYKQAAANYLPGIHSDRLVVFKPTEDSASSSEIWGRFAGGGLEVHEVPGNHTDVVNKEDCVRVWAQQLRTHLESAQSAVIQRDRAVLPTDVTAVSSGHVQVDSCSTG